MSIKKSNENIMKSQRKKWGWKLESCQKNWENIFTKMLPKSWFLRKISIFDQNLDFKPTFRFLTIILFLSKISIFYQNFNFRPNYRFVTIHFNFWLLKSQWVSIFDQTADVWSQFRFLTKLHIFDQTFDF